MKPHVDDDNEDRLSCPLRAPRRQQQHRGDDDNICRSSNNNNNNSNETKASQPNVGDSNKRRNSITSDIDRPLKKRRSVGSGGGGVEEDDEETSTTTTKYNKNSPSSASSSSSSTFSSSSACLFISGIKKNDTPDDLVKFLRTVIRKECNNNNNNIPEILKCRLINDNHPSLPPHAMVTLSDPSQARTAITVLHGITYSTKGSRLIVKPWKKKKKTTTKSSSSSSSSSSKQGSNGQESNGSSLYVINVSTKASVNDLITFIEKSMMGKVSVIEGRVVPSYKKKTMKRFDKNNHHDDNNDDNRTHFYNAKLTLSNPKQARDVLRVVNGTLYSGLTLFLKPWKEELSSSYSPNETNPRLAQKGDNNNNNNNNNNNDHSPTSRLSPKKKNDETDATTEKKRIFTVKESAIFVVGIPKQCPPDFYGLWHDANDVCNPLIESIQTNVANKSKIDIESVHIVKCHVYMEEGQQQYYTAFVEFEEPNIAQLALQLNTISFYGIELQLIPSLKLLYKEKEKKIDISEDVVEGAILVDGIPSFSLDQIDDVRNQLLTYLGENLSLVMGIDRRNVYFCDCHFNNNDLPTTQACVVFSDRRMADKAVTMLKDLTFHGEQLIVQKWNDDFFIGKCYNDNDDCGSTGDRCSIYVRNVPTDATEDELSRYFTDLLMRFNLSPSSDSRSWIRSRQRDARVTFTNPSAVTLLTNMKTVDYPTFHGNILSFKPWRPRLGNAYNVAVRGDHRSSMVHQVDDNAFNHYTNPDHYYSDEIGERRSRFDETVGGGLRHNLGVSPSSAAIREVSHVVKAVRPHPSEEITRNGVDLKESVSKLNSTTESFRPQETSCIEDERILRNDYAQATVAAETLLEAKMQQLLQENLRLKDELEAAKASCHAETQNAAHLQDELNEQVKVNAATDAKLADFQSTIFTTEKKHQAEIQNLMGANAKLGKSLLKEKEQNKLIQDASVNHEALLAKVQEECNSKLIKQKKDHIAQMSKEKSKYIEKAKATATKEKEILKDQHKKQLDYCKKVHASENEKNEKLIAELKKENEKLKKHSNKTRTLSSEKEMVEKELSAANEKVEHFEALEATLSKDKQDLLNEVQALRMEISVLTSSGSEFQSPKYLALEKELETVKKELNDVKVFNFDQSRSHCEEIRHIKKELEMEAEKRKSLEKKILLYQKGVVGGAEARQQRHVLAADTKETSATVEDDHKEIDFGDYDI